jgi:predicted ATPase
MTKPAPTTQALRLPNGARFYRCALQVNPHHYAGAYRGQPQRGNETTYVKEIVAKCQGLGIQVIGIADHNHCGSVGLFQREAAQHDIHVFPGFEVSSSEGVHVVCLYPPGTEDAQLSRFLGELGIRDPGPSADLCDKTLVELLACVRTQGGVTIAAHVTQPNGLFVRLEGQPCINAWRSEHLLAVQIPGAVKDTPQEIQQILRNKNPDYHREPGVAEDLAVAVVNTKDVATAKDLEDSSASCWVKMSEISIEGFRQAFLDPVSRIRLASDPVPEEHAEFLAAAWQGGFLDGAAIHFNENLNVLIGGRGTGKSTVVESLRYCLGLEPLGDEARAAHEGIVQEVLRSGTKITLLVASDRPPPKREYRIERTVPNPPIVRDDSGEVLPLTPADVVPQVEVYGQHEIAELSKSPQKLTRLLERFVQADRSLPQRKLELRRELERSRTRIAEARRELSQLHERLAALPGVEETLKRFQEAGLEERLKEQSMVVREERIFRTASERLTPFRDLLEQLRRELPIERAFLSTKSLEELPGRGILAEASGVLERISNDIEALATSLEEALRKAEADLAAVGDKWGQRKQQVQQTYEAILRELQRAKVDGEEFIRLRRQIENLRPLNERQSVLERILKELEARRLKLLAEWEEVKAEEFRQLDRASKNVSRRLANRVQVEVTFAGNRDPLFELIRERLEGRLAETFDTLRARHNLSLTEFAAACRVGREALVRQFSLPPAQADRLAQAAPEVFMEIEELDLPPTTAIKLNVAPEGQPSAWKGLDDLSKGQKATAVLLLLLLESDAPLIVDQPEDDLDNRFITEGVVPKMREEKRRRQFIFSTHNANIPVLGDAELILGLTAAGEADAGRAEIPSQYMGSIDASAVRELVEEILEGGKEAFELRRMKYGF